MLRWITSGSAQNVTVLPQEALFFDVGVYLVVIGLVRARRAELEQKAK